MDLIGCNYVMMVYNEVINYYGKVVLIYEINDLNDGYKVLK